jgi:hypothetical protein
MTKAIIKQEDINQITEIFKPLLGEVAWNVKLGIGSFLTMEFGNSISISSSDKRGEWYLWIYCGGWYLENPNGVFIGSEDSRDNIGKEIQVLEGHKLINILISTVAFETRFVFDDGIVLHTFPLSFFDDCESWKLFTPVKKVLLINPNGEWSYELADKAL